MNSRNPLQQPTETIKTAGYYNRSIALLAGLQNSLIK